MRRRPAHIRDLLKSCPAGNTCLQPQDAAADFSAKLLALLPEPLRAHCVAEPIRAGTLTLVVDSPAWATRARYLGAELKSRLEGLQIDAVRVLVRPPLPAAPIASPSRGPRITTGTARLLRQAADAADDPVLSRALRNLALRGVGERDRERDD